MSAGVGSRCVSPLCRGARQTGRPWRRHAGTAGRPFAAVLRHTQCLQPLSLPHDPLPPRTPLPPCSRSLERKPGAQCFCPLHALHLLGAVASAGGYSAKELVFDRSQALTTGQELALHQQCVRQTHAFGHLLVDRAVISSMAMPGCAGNGGHVQQGCTFWGISPRCSLSSPTHSLDKPRLNSRNVQQ